MLIAFYLFVVNVALPQLGSYADALLEPVMTIVITLAGIVMLFGAVGLKISNNLGSTIVGGIFRITGYLCHTIIKAIGCIIRYTFRLIPRVFTESRRAFSQMGLSTLLSNLLSVMVVTIVVAIII